MTAWLHVVIKLRTGIL